jgi:hypothetical protein
MTVILEELAGDEESAWAGKFQCRSFAPIKGM